MVPHRKRSAFYWSSVEESDGEEASGSQGLSCPEVALLVLRPITFVLLMIFLAVVLICRGTATLPEFGTGASGLAAGGLGLVTNPLPEEFAITFKGCRLPFNRIGLLGKLISGSTFLSAFLLAVMATVYFFWWDADSAAAPVLAAAVTGLAGLSFDTSKLTHPTS